MHAVAGFRPAAEGTEHVGVACPAEDPGGCETSLEVRTARRFGAVLRLLRARAPLRLAVRSVALDNARNTRATVLLRR